LLVLVGPTDRQQRCVGSFVDPLHVGGVAAVVWVMSLCQTAPGGTDVVAGGIAPETERVERIGHRHQTPASRSAA
jgi:hypothetical protein